MKLTHIVVGCGLVGACSWWLWSGSEPAAAPVAKEKTFPWASTPEPDAGTYAKAPAEGVKQRPVAAQSKPEGESNVWDLCGLGRMGLPLGMAQDVASEGIQALPAPLGSEPLAQARRHMVSSLQMAQEPRAQVVAQLLMKPEPTDGAALEAWAQTTLQKAVTQPDLIALTWAEEACGFLPGNGSQGQDCRVQLIRARLKLEPGNAVHWAALAEEDPTTAEEAWYGMRNATTWKESAHDMVLITQQALAQHVPGYLRMNLGVELASRQGALSAPGQAFLQERCQEQSSGRSGECQALAQMLVEKGDSTRALVLGLEVGQAAGWSSERQASLQAELAALARADWTHDPSQPLSCKSVEAWQSHLKQVESIGEIGTLRQRAREVLAVR